MYNSYRPTDGRVGENRELLLYFCLFENRSNSPTVNPRETISSDLNGTDCTVRKCVVVGLGRGPPSFVGKQFDSIIGTLTALGDGGIN